MNTHDTPAGKAPSTVPAQAPHSPPHWQSVPIRSIGPSHRERILAHLLALPAPDRYLRFGYGANDKQIARYVDSINFERDDIFGIHNRRLELIGMAHLAYMKPSSAQACAEFGVSVLPYARGRGYGARLFERAAMHARNANIDLLHIHALSENTVMLRIARNGGASVERQGSEAEAQLRLAPATFDSHVNEMMQEQFAQTDYLLKLQAGRLSSLMTGFQGVGFGIKPAQQTSQPAALAERHARHAP